MLAYRGFRGKGLRPFANQTHHVAVAHAKDRAVHHEEGHQADAHMQVTVCGNRVCCALQTINYPRLAAHFRGHPAGEDRHQTGWSHQQCKPQERTRGIEGLLLAQPQRDNAEQQHQHAQPGHDAERPEDDCRVWPVFFGKLLQRRNLFVQTMGEDQAAERGDLQPITGTFLFHIRPAEQQ